jgi:CheY-like chemotaxis protein
MPSPIPYLGDKPDLQEIGRIFLDEPGDFSVVTISSAPASLDILIKGNFDAIISDYLMPGMEWTTI